MRQTRLLAAIVVLLACLPVAAQAKQSVALHMTFTPERLGAGTTMILDIQVATTTGQAPSPLTALDLSYPANLGIVTSGLGVATCSIDTLEEVGPEGCPADSRMGYGSALVEVPFGPELVKETGSIAIFMAPVQNGDLALNFFADGKTPIATELIFPSLVLPSPPPYGGRLRTIVPPVPTLPGAPYAALIRLRSTIGTLDLTYYEHVHGRTVPYKPQGIVLPAHCPRAGFPFAATFTFLDGTHASARTSVPCPDTARR